MDDPRYEVIWLIRRLFRGLGARADEYLRESDLSSADRAVMEFLYPDGLLSVPEIATRYQVSRQHIQVTVNGLLQLGLLRAQANPKHKRSPLIRLSELGRQTFGEIRDNESEAINELFSELTESDLNVTRRSLQQLLHKLD